MKRILVVVLLSLLAPIVAAQAQGEAPALEAPAGAGAQGITVIPNRGMQAGSGKWMQIPDNPSIAIPVFTVEVWVQATSGGLIVTRDVPSGSPSDWQLWYDFSRLRLAFITARTPPDSYFYTPDNSFLPGQWYHISLVVNGPAGTAKLYLNGALVISPTFTSRYFDCSTGLAWCGYYNNGSGAYLQGIIDEARYWNYERSQAQILATKDIDVPSNDRAGLVGWWRFCDSFEDYSGAGNHGTPMGNPQLVLINLPFGITCDENPCDTVRVTITGDRVFCEGDSTTLTASAGFRSYRWSTGDTTQSIVVRTGNSYRVSAVVNDSCAASAEINVQTLPLPAVDAGPDINACKGVVATLGRMTPMPGWVYRWTPMSDLSTPDEPVTNVQTATSRSYVLTVTNTDGCTASDTVNIFIRDGIPMTLPDSIQVCPGSSVILPLALQGGVPPFYFEWSPPDGLSDTDIQNPVAATTRARWYHVRVTDSLGCEEIDSILVSLTGGIETDLPDSILVCRGATVLLPLGVRNGTPPWTFSWTPATGLDRSDIQTPAATVDSSRWYHVAVRDNAGCEGFDSVFVRVGQGIRTIMPDTVYICAGGSTVLPLDVTGHVGGLTFQWTPPDDLSNPGAQKPVARPKGTTTYHVHVVDSLGCEARDSITVALYPAVDITISIDGAARFCEGDSVRLVATPGYRTYRWYTPSRVIPDTGNTIIAREAGTYRVAVIDSNGCETISQPVTITTFTAFAIPVTLNGTQPLCEGDSLLLEAGGAYRDYVWTDDSGRVLGIGRRLVVGRAGRFRVIARDSLGCVGSSEAVAVTIEPKPVFPLNGPRIVCLGSVHDYSTLSRSRWAYEWAADTGDPQTTTNRESVRIAWRTPGRMTLRLLVRDKITGCADSVSVEVLVITEIKPVILAGGPLVFCEGDSVVLRSRDPHDQSQWTDSAGTVIGTGRAVTIYRSGMYYFRASTPDGCSGIDSMRVTVLPAPMPRILGPVIVCIGDTAVYTHAGGSGLLRWTTTGGLTLEEDSTRLLVRWDRAGVYRIIAQLTETSTALRCTGTDTLEVEVQLPPDASLAAFPDTVICETDSVRLSASPGYSRYIWSTPDGTIDTTASELIVRRAGKYTLRVISSGGCEAASREINITVHPAPDAMILGPVSVCRDGLVSYTVNSSQNTTYQWFVTGGAFESATSGARVDIRWMANGRGTVAVVADNGFCRSIDTLLVEVGDSVKPVISAEPLRFCPGGEATLRTDDGYASYTWLTPDGSVGGQQITVRRAGVYRVHVTTASGCDGTSDLVVIEELPAPLPVIVGPDVLCPGDTLQLQVPAGYASYSWSDGSRGRFCSVYGAATLTVTVVDSNGCTGTSRAHSVRLHPSPEIPTITRDGMTLVCTPATSYQWYRNDTLLAGETARECRITMSGYYRVATANEFGCPAGSDILPVDCAFGRSVVALPHLFVSPGDTVHIDPSMIEQLCLEEIGAREFSAALRFNKTMLVPLDGTPPGIIDGTDRVITVAGTMQALLGRTLELRFLAMLGNRDSIPLILDAFEWIDVPVSAERVNGSLRLRICREGGDRLFDAEGQLQLRQNRPNPFNTMTVIEYELIERGETELYILNILGRRVRTLYAGPGEPGAHQLAFDAGDLPTGQYILVLRTPTAVLHRVMSLLK